MTARRNTRYRGRSTARKPLVLTREVIIPIVAVSCGLAIVADLSGALEGGPPEFILLVSVLVAGCMTLPSWKSGWVGAIACLIAAIHSGIFFLVGANDSRTFFGGAMYPVIAFYGWALVTVWLLVTTALGKLVRSR